MDQLKLHQEVNCNKCVGRGGRLQIVISFLALPVISMKIITIKEQSDYLGKTM
jgi:hypothetical protein